MQLDEWNKSKDDEGSDLQISNVKKRITRGQALYENVARR